MECGGKYVFDTSDFWRIADVWVSGFRFSALHRPRVPSFGPSRTVPRYRNPHRSYNANRKCRYHASTWLSTHITLSPAGPLAVRTIAVLVHPPWGFQVSFDYIEHSGIVTLISNPSSRVRLCFTSLKVSWRLCRDFECALTACSDKKGARAVRGSW